MAHELAFNVAQLLKEPVGSTRDGEIRAAFEGMDPELDLPDAATLTGPVRLMHVTDGVLVQANLMLQTTVACTRCLEPAQVSVPVTVVETFTPTIDVISGQRLKPEEPDQALWIDEHHILDLSEVIRQGILLAMPLHVVCQENCRGLCPNCGQNLNQAACGCEEEPDPRLAVLRNLLNQ